MARLLGGLRAVLALSLGLTPAVVAAADGCKPQTSYSVPLVLLRDGRAGFPVAFGEAKGVLIADTAAVAQTATDANRKSVPITGTNIEEMSSARLNYATIAGTLTPKTLETLGLTAIETGARFTGAASGRREMKVSVNEFAIQSLPPSNAEFLVSDPDTRLTDYAGTFALNNFRLLGFDLDLDVARRSARFYSRECTGQPEEWAALTVARIPFTIDGNGFIKVDVAVDGKSVAALLDTGSVVTTLDFGFASRSFRIKESDPSLTKVTEMADGRAVYQRQFDSVGFGDVSAVEAQILLVPGIRGRSEGPPTGSRVDRERRGTLPPLLLGMSVLRQLRLYFAFDERAIYVARSETVRP